ncbi:MAG: hypothetical protein AB8B99_11370 [Phormidesmis sp.]
MTKTRRPLLIAPLILLSVSLSSCGAIAKVILQAAVEETIECSFDPDCGKSSASGENPNPPVTTSGTAPAPLLEPAPADPAPAKPVPADPVPVDPAPAESVPVTPDAENNRAENSEYGRIVRYVNNSAVDFESRSLRVSGNVIQTDERERQKAYDSGVVARIEWEDGVISTILFLRDSRVRVWDEGLEYEGKWFWGASDTLQVRMDEGSRYVFR